MGACNLKTAREYDRRALNYVRVFDGATRFFRGRQADGGWSEPFARIHGRSATIPRLRRWQYRFFAPHDVNGLEQLFGGREAFVRELDRLFTLESPHEDAGLVDITGLMGQYAHGNEPSHHMADLYSYVGQPWKTQELTRRLLDEMYAPTPEGMHRQRGLRADVGVAYLLLRWVSIRCVRVRTNSC